ncbi:hypothetical protein ACFYVL_34185 [Streptomyces sp. NPDC004111]|uniref:hypothetical protein n=1 Tax=Streptomyces sp. NPDC004111 TaxID=3364690 RepID=UPI0036C7F3B9
MSCTGGCFGAVGKTIGVVVGLVVIVVAAKIAVGDKVNLFGRNWAVTYEAGSPGDKPLAVKYQDTEGRYPGQDRSVKEHDVAAVGTAWSKETVVLDGREARVTVTPEKGERATCRILLDGRKVLATGKSSAPGLPAVCTAKPSS